VAEDTQPAYEAGFAAAQRGEEAAPGCTANAAGRAFLQGYIDGRAALGAGSARVSIGGSSSPPLCVMAVAHLGGSA
jgi:hypothetical protein